MILPDWKEIEGRIENKEPLTPIEQFIYDDMSPVEEGAFKRLEAAIDYAVDQAKAKMPTLEECQAHVQREMWGSHMLANSTSITELVYNFIVEKLSE